MLIPAALGWWSTRPGGAEWLARLPDLATRLAERWRLELGAPFTGGLVSLSLPARRADGTEAVLKLRLPDEESRHEPDALELWAGVGAARLLERDDEAWAMLLERLRPGSPLLGDDEDTVVEVVARLLGTLHARPAPAAPFASLVDVAARWARELPERWERLGRPFEEDLVTTAVETCLAPHADGRVVVHQDLHAGNVLRDGRGWRVIDPKPLVGEPAFDGAAILRDRHWQLDADDVARLVPRRLKRLAAATGYDRDRLRRWGITHTLAWGVGAEGADAGMVACARALLRAG